MERGLSPIADPIAIHLGTVDQFRTLNRLIICCGLERRPCFRSYNFWTGLDKKIAWRDHISKEYSRMSETREIAAFMNEDTFFVSIALG